MIEFINNQAISVQDGAKIFVTGDVNEDMVSELQKDIELCKNAGVKTITFCINSPGGSVSDGMAMYDIVSALNDIETTAEIQGLCASAATYLPLACDNVVMHANSDFMIHEPEGGFFGTVQTATSDLEYFSVLRERIIAIYCSKTGLTPAEIEVMLKEAKFMSAKRCKELNFIDEIVGDVGDVDLSEKEDKNEETKEDKETEQREEHNDEHNEEKPVNFFSLKNILNLLKDNNISFIKAENDEFASQVEINNTLTEKVKNLESQLEAKQKSYDEIVNRLEEQKKDIDKQIQIAVANKIASMGYTDELPLPEKSKKMTDNEFRNALIEVYRKQGYEAAAKFTKSREEGEI